MAKKVSKAAPVKKAVTKKIAKPVEVKEEGFLMLVVFKVTHGGFFSKHTHYTSNLLKVKNEDEARNNLGAARKAAKTMSKEIGIKTEVVIAERVEATDKDQMRGEVLAKMSGEVSEILKGL